MVLTDGQFAIARGMNHAKRNLLPDGTKSTVGAH